MKHSTKSGCELQQDHDISREVCGDLHWWKRPKATPLSKPKNLQRPSTI